MRISNISDFAGGATAVRYREFVNGEVRTTSGQLLLGPENAQTATNLSSYDFDLYAEYASIMVNVERSRATITELSLVTDDSAFRSSGTAIMLPRVDLSANVTLDPNDNTRYSILWPSTLYPAAASVPFNANSTTAVPAVIATLYLADNRTADDVTSRYAIRYILPVRYGVQMP